MEGFQAIACHHVGYKNVKMFKTFVEQFIYKFTYHCTYKNNMRNKDNYTHIAMTFQLTSNLYFLNREFLLK